MLVQEVSCAMNYIYSIWVKTCYFINIFLYLNTRYYSINGLFRNIYCKGKMISLYLVLLYLRHQKLPFTVSNFTWHNCIFCFTTASSYLLFINDFPHSKSCCRLLASQCTLKKRPSIQVSSIVMSFHLFCSSLNWVTSLSYYQDLKET